MSIAYGGLFAFSLILLPLYFIFLKKKHNEPWLFILFLCVSTVNLGYLLISISQTVEFALFANKIAYLGQIIIPVCMLRIISRLCGFRHKAWVSIVLYVSAGLMFALVCTTGYLDWYYKDASLGECDGASYLIKEYGFLHPTILIYVVGYFLLLLGIILFSLFKNRGSSQKLAALMLAVVLGNIGMWIIEKLIFWSFELLAVSYVMSELVFFFVYILLDDYIHKSDVPRVGGAPVIVVDSLERAEKLRLILSHLPEGVSLSARQTDALEGLVDGKSRKEIAADLHLSENTVKMHTASLYRLLGVSNREEIHALIKV